MDFKIIICGRSIYQEIELHDDTKPFKIGNTKGCKVRFEEKQFPVTFAINVESVNGNWEMRCSESLFMQTRNGSTGQGCIPKPGNRIKIISSHTREEIFQIDFFQDFKVVNRDYDLEIATSSMNRITIGNNGNDICLNKVYMPDEMVSIEKKDRGYLIDARNIRTGMFINGVPMMETIQQISNKDFFAVKGYQFFIKDGVLYTTSDGSISTKLTSKVIQHQKNHLSYPKFIRNARQQYELPDEKIEILDPKALPQEPQKNFLQSLIPTFLSMILMAMMRGMMGGRGVYLIYSVVMMGVGVLTSVITYRNSGKDYRINLKKREELYRKYLEEQEQKIRELRDKEYSISCHTSPSVSDDIEKIFDFDGTLFEKRREHDDFLRVYLGKGAVRSKCQVGYKKHEYIDTDDVYMDYPMSISKKYELIDDMPVTVSLKDHNAVGFIGNRNSLYEMAKNLIINISAEHFYQDVKLFYVLEKNDIEQFQWARWLQNSFMGDCSIRNFMFDEESDKVVLEYLYSQLSEREKANENGNVGYPHFVIFMYRSQRIANHPLMNFVKKAKQLNVSFIFFEEYEEFINQECEQQIYLHPQENKGLLQSTYNGEDMQEFTYEIIPEDTVQRIASKLACVYVDEISLESALTKNITLYELLNIDHADELDLGERWEKTKVYESMAAPLGVKTGNEIVSLDLHEKFHGPHGLVAGTTGSGKSEILQAYILSMATLYHPYEVSFVIIDFKGGGMANQFKKLPHLIGAITNIDGKEIERSLKSIKAELMKRQSLFAQYEVNHIDEYIKLYRKGITTVPLPHLILIVDEFAELKAEQPDFMKELISTARIGRSLGVHLILATQKPSGVVNDQIWSNSKFKLCLKVQNQNDSKEVIKSPLAAEIREPGRAYLQVGNNEVFQLFQSAYSGAPVPSASIGKVKKYELSQVMLDGRRSVFFKQKPKQNEDAVTQLDELVEYVNEYCIRQKIKKLPSICLPPLEQCIDYVNDGNVINEYQRIITLGIYDDPEHQKFEKYSLNLNAGHVLIIGSSQYGKTNLLQVMIRGLAEQYTTEQVNIYILDFASMMLRSFQNLNHVGDVLTLTDDEKLKNFMENIMREYDSRKTLLSEVGLSSYGAYLETGECKMPQIVIFMENMPAFRDNYSQYEKELMKLAQDGASVGIILVATAQQTGNMGYKYLAYFPQRICTYNHNSAEYSSVFERCRMKLDEIPGRTIIAVGKQNYEMQTYLAFKGEKEAQRVSMIKSFIEVQNSKMGGKVHSFCDGNDIKQSNEPNEVEESEQVSVFDKAMLEKMREPNREKYVLPLGLNKDTNVVEELDILSCPILGISAEEGMGKHNYLGYFIEEFLAHKNSEPVRITIFDGDRQRLKKYSSQCEYHTYDEKTISDTIYGLGKIAEERKTMSKVDIDKEPLYLIFINDHRLQKYIETTDELMDICQRLVVELHDLKICLILSDLPNEPFGSDRKDFNRILRYNRNLIVFRKIQEQRMVFLSGTWKEEHSEELVSGEAICNFGTYICKVSTPLNE